MALQLNDARTMMSYRARRHKLVGQTTYHSEPNDMQHLKGAQEHVVDIVHGEHANNEMTFIRRSTQHPAIRHRIQ